MGTTLSNGYKRPSAGDTDWWDQQEDNIQRMNDHDHDGVTGEKIAARNVTKSTSTIAASDWGSDLGGSSYSCTVSMPAGHEFDNAVFLIYDTDSGAQIQPTLTKVNATSFTLMVNDNTLNLKVIYA